MSMINLQAGEVTANHASANMLVSDGRTTREYYLFVAKTYVTVVAGKQTRRTLGKTFHNFDEVTKHYKRDGRVLREVVDQLTQMRLEAN